MKRIWAVICHGVLGARVLAVSMRLVVLVLQPGRERQYCIVVVFGSVYARELKGKYIEEQEKEMLTVVICKETHGIFVY